MSPGSSLSVAYALGTRPEVIRSSRLLQLMESDPRIDLILINSGQHYDANMLPEFLSELAVPKVSVDLEVGSADGAQQTATVLARAAEYLRYSRPDVLCVFGDTNSSLGAALAAAKLQIPLVHIESGCRSFDMTMPEEINRRLIDHVAGLLLAVSPLGRANLLEEAVRGEIRVVGDPQFDVFNRERATLANDALKKHGLVTLHRPENADNPERLLAILEGLSKVSRKRDLMWIFPVHPRTQLSLASASPEGIHMTEPLPYKGLLEALRSSSICVTDSGGLQKEALWMRVPCITVRTTTEWMETVHQKANKLVAIPGDLSTAITEAIDQANTADFSNPYGDGFASERTVEAILDWTSNGDVFPSNQLTRSGGCR